MARPAPPAIDVTGLERVGTFQADGRLNGEQAAVTWDAYATGNPSQPVIVERLIESASGEVFTSQFAGTRQADPLGLSDYRSAAVAEANRIVEVDVRWYALTMREAIEFEPAVITVDRKPAPGEHPKTQDERAVEERPPPAPPSQTPTEETPAQGDAAVDGGAEGGPRPEDRATDLAGGEEGPAPVDEFDTAAAVAQQLDWNVHQSKRATAGWTADLESWVLDAGEPSGWRVGVATAGATGLGALDLAMDVGASWLDWTRFGEGMASGTWGGAGQDALRLTSIVPGAKVAVTKGITLLKPLAMTAKATAAGSAGGASLAGIGAAAGTIKKAKHGLYTGRELTKMRQLARAVFEDPRKIVYQAARRREIGTYKTIQTALKGEGTGMEVHHLLPKSLLHYTNDPKFAGLDDFIPSIIVTGGKNSEHMAVMHSALDDVLRQAQVWKTPISEAELRKALSICRDFYTSNRLHEEAAAITEFTARFIDKI